MSCVQFMVEVIPYISRVEEMLKIFDEIGMIKEPRRQILVHALNVINDLNLGIEDQVSLGEEPMSEKAYAEMVCHHCCVLADGLEHYLALEQIEGEPVRGEHLLNCGILRGMVLTAAGHEVTWTANAHWPVRRMSGLGEFLKIDQPDLISARVTIRRYRKKGMGGHYPLTTWISSKLKID